MHVPSCHRSVGKARARVNNNLCEFTLAQFHRVGLDTVLDAGHISRTLPFAVLLSNRMKNTSVDKKKRRSNIDK